MNSPKKSISTTRSNSAKTISPTGLEKLKSSQKIDLQVVKAQNFEDLEIIITVKDNDLVVKLLRKGILESQQANPIKPKPSPPPVETEIINAINSLKLNLSVKR